MRFLQILEKSLFLWRIETVITLVIQGFWASFCSCLDCLKEVHVYLVGFDGIDERIKFLVYTHAIVGEFIL